MTAAAHTPGEWERTIGEARLDLDYAITYSAMNQRFYERLHKGMAFVALLCGTAAFVTVFHPNSVVVTVAGVAVGIMALAEQVYDFRGKGVAHAGLLKRFMQFKTRSARLDRDAFDKEMDKIAADAIPGIQGLRKPAHNENMRRNGYLDRVMPLNRWERLLEMVV